MYDANGRNLRLLSQVLHDAWDDDPGPAVPWSLLEGLNQLVPCDDCVSYQVNDLRERHIVLHQDAGDGVDGRAVAVASDDEGGTDVFYDLFWTNPMCSYALRTGDRQSVIQTSDFFTQQSLHRDRLWSEFLRCNGIRHTH